MERGLSALRDTGLTEDEKVAVQLLVSGFVRNEAMLAADIAASPVLGQTMASYGAILAKLTDPQRFPAVRAAIAAGVLDDDGTEDPDEWFTFGLERVLDGVDALVHARQSPQQRL